MCVCVCVCVCTLHTEISRDLYFVEGFFQGLKCRFTGIPANIMSLENSHAYVWYVLYVCVAACYTLSLPETVAPVGHSLTQYRSAG